MKPQIEKLIQHAVSALQAAGELPELTFSFHVEPAKDKQHGDYASNIAMVLANAAQKTPRDIAELIVKALPAAPQFAKIEVAGPGFINFYLAPDALHYIVPTILQQQHEFGRSKIGRAKRVLVEFVSANPSSPLHVGHGRHAVFGAVVSNLLDAVGFITSREYYVNDVGQQMDILTVSVWLRYLGLCGEVVAFPANAYRGDYVIDIARQLREAKGDALTVPAAQVMEALPKDEPDGDKEVYLDAVIARAKQLLGASHYLFVFDLALAGILKDISDDLAEFGIYYDNWFSERAFCATNAVDKALDVLRGSGHTYEKDGALWFRTTDFGDEKDRILVRANGVRTYFCNDAAYHLNKFERGFDIALDVLGTNHQCYLARMKAVVAASGVDPERLICLLGQFVTLYRQGEPVQMSTRSGEFVTLRELREEVGNDAARFFYLTRKYDHQIDFDLDLAKSKTNENPVYYVQYAHARICSVFSQLSDKQLDYNENNGLSNLTLLTAAQETEIMTLLARYPDVITDAAINYEPHLLTQYLRELAASFHAYYNAEHFIVDDKALRDARLVLVSAVKQVLMNGFNLLGISAPETM